jgi:hypothetical protein
MSELTRRSVLAGATAAGASALTSALPTTAQAAAPLSVQQAPGYYRYKVGTHEITAVTDGATASSFPTVL